MGQYDEFFELMRRDKAFADVTFKVRGGDIKLITMNQTYKDIGDAVGNIGAVPEPAANDQ